jgi:hypothetical protein
MSMKERIALLESQKKEKGISRIHDGIVQRSS